MKMQYLWKKITKKPKSPPLSPNIYAKIFLQRSFCCFANIFHPSGLLRVLGSPTLPTALLVAAACEDGGPVHTFPWDQERCHLLPADKEKEQSLWVPAKLGWDSHGWNWLFSVMRAAGFISVLSLSSL